MPQLPAPQCSLPPPEQWRATSYTQGTGSWGHPAGWGGCVCTCSMTPAGETMSCTAATLGDHPLCHILQVILAGMCPVCIHSTACSTAPAARRLGAACHLLIPGSRRLHRSTCGWGQLLNAAVHASHESCLHMLRFGTRPTAGCWLCLGWHSCMHMPHISCAVEPRPLQCIDCWPHPFYE
jgi:hypothetical protein